MPKATKSNPSTTIDTRIAQLEQAVAWFSSDDFKLEDAKAHYESAVQLATAIKDDLASLKNEIEVLKI